MIYKCQIKFKTALRIILPSSRSLLKVTEFCGEDGPRSQDRNLLKHLLSYLVLLFLTRKPGKCPNANGYKNDTLNSESCGAQTM